MSLRLLLEDYLGLMKEDGELDVFLPTLLSAMGHEIIFRPQKGTRQYGADIVSVGKDEDAIKKVFVWLVKCGDITRDNWDTGKQSVRQSAEDVGDTYLTSHVPTQFKKLPAKLVILTNGDVGANLTLTLRTYLDKWTTRHSAEATTVTGSTLAIWTERYLLDENVLPQANRALFRRMLATVSSVEICVATGQQLIDNIVAAGLLAAKSQVKTRKNQLSALRAIRTALSVLNIWAQGENNFQAAYKLAEYAILAVWSGFHGEMVDKENAEVAREYSYLLFQLLGIGEAYHAKLQPYYRVQNAFALALPDNILVTERVFEELGRLGLLTCIWALYGALDEVDGRLAVHHAHMNASRIIVLLESHACAQSPCHDHQAIDIHIALLGLTVTNRVVEANNWIVGIVIRLREIVRFNKKYWPLTANFQDLLAVRHGDAEVSNELLNISTMLPILAIWASALKLEDVYAGIRNEILPEIPEATLNTWNSECGFEDILANPAKLQDHGVAQAFKALPETSQQFLDEMITPLPDIASIEASSWYRARCPYIPLLASLCWRLQLPREMLAKHVQALAAAMPVETGTNAAT